MNDTIQTLAERLAEALHGNATTISTPMGLVILAPLPGANPSPAVVQEPPKDAPPTPVEPPKVAPPTPVEPPKVAPPTPVEPPKAAVTPSALRDLARQAAAKIGADQVRAILGKPIVEIKPSEADAIAAKLRAVL